MELKGDKIKSTLGDEYNQGLSRRDSISVFNKAVKPLGFNSHFPQK